MSAAIASAFSVAATAKARPFNFSPGPATLPLAVLEQAAAELTDWHGTGMSVMEMSHRGVHFEQIFEQTLADFRELMAIPDDYAVLFLQGGAVAENAIVPLNLMGRGVGADYVLTGHWSIRSAAEATRYGPVHVSAHNGLPLPPELTDIAANHNADAPAGAYLPDPAQWRLHEQSAYLHLCANETIGGVAFNDWSAVWPALPADLPVVADMSSEWLSRPIDVSRFGLLYGGAQKNIGPAGLTLVVIRRDLLGHAHAHCPSAFDYTQQADQHSMVNTPPTYAIYLAGLVFAWIKAQGGVNAMAARNQEKADWLYGAIDASAYYRNRVVPAARSRMNVPFTLPDAESTTRFLQEAQQVGLYNLKGHKAAGGIRASIYNAMPPEGVRALVDFMQDFERRHG